MESRTSEAAMPFVGTLTILWRHRVSIIVAGICGGILGLLVSFLQEPIYRAEVTLAPVQSPAAGQSLSGLTGQLGGLIGGAGGLLGGRSSETEQWIAVLKSRVLIESLIETNNLLPVLFAEEWDAANGRWIAEEADKRPTMDKAYRRFDQRVRKVTKDAQTGLVTLRIEWVDPNLAANWARQMVVIANQRIRERAIGEATASISFLEKEAERTSNLDLQTAINTLIQAQINARMLASVREEYAFAVIDPPAVADPSEYVKPKRFLNLVLGSVLAAMLLAFYLLGRTILLSDLQTANTRD